MDNMLNKVGQQIALWSYKIEIVSSNNKRKNGVYM